MNEEITVEKVRLISEEGEQFGIVSTEDAMKKAEEAELDLVEVSPNSDPPVCRIMNYGKYKYEQQRKEHKARKNARQQEVKELRLGRSVMVEQHDIDFKLKKAREILERGHRLLIFMQLRGREMAHAEIGVDRINQFAAALEDIAKLEQTPNLDRRRITAMLTPLPASQRKQLEKQRRMQAETVVEVKDEVADEGDAGPEIPAAPAMLVADPVDEEPEEPEVEEDA